MGTKNTKSQTEELNRIREKHIEDIKRERGRVFSTVLCAVLLIFGLQIFYPSTTIITAGIIFKFIVSLVVLLMLCAGFFYIKEQLIKYKKFFCPYCNRAIEVSSFWKCPYCDKINKEGVFKNCWNCKKLPDLIQCPDCYNIIKFKENNDGMVMKLLKKEEEQTEREQDFKKSQIIKSNPSPIQPSQANFPQLPNSLDHEADLTFIRSQIVKIQNNPSMTANYFTALRAKFNLRKQIELLNSLEVWMKTLASGVASKTDLLEKQREFLIAQNDLLTINDDLEIKKLEKELEKEKKRTGIAEQKAKQRELQKPHEPLENIHPEVKAYKEKENVKFQKTEIKEEYQNKIRKRKILKRFEGKADIEKLYNKEKEKLKSKFNSIQNPTPQEIINYGKELENLEDKYYQILDSED